MGLDFSSDVSCSSGGKFMDKPVGIPRCVEKLPERQQLTRPGAEQGADVGVLPDRCCRLCGVKKIPAVEFGSRSSYLGICSPSLGGMVASCRSAFNMSFRPKLTFERVFGRFLKS